ncbi:MAG: outer membrane beta-barrel protein [Bacteroidetes bacterium]|nr:outer membrane beta-barrel protein [Bacteroidota bacterium]
MRYLTLCFLCFLLLSAGAFAQNNYSAKGVAADSVEHVKLGNTSIVVLQAKDSILVKYTRAAADGSFDITGLSKGKYILLASYPDYADYTESFSLDSAHQVHNFGHLNMSLKSRLLKEVIIKGTAAQMKIKGDTTEFNARAFVTQPNAKVEDLLKQIPGITVDKDGKITAQGESVGKVLVDGEEFFGDDPTLVTKNIRADMVDKVQIFDKKSDQATFTGIDDGQRTKTINIKLREDKKNGYFGKVDVGYGTNNYNEGQLLFNRFKGKAKFSVYGTLGNDGKTGLGWEDSQKYAGGSDNVQLIDGGGIMITSGGDDLDSFSGNYNGKGTPIARTGGAHFDDKFNNDKETVNVNYKVGALTVDGTDNTLTQNNFAPGIAINSNSNQTYHNYSFRQKLDLTYTIKLDTSSTLKLHVDGTLRNSQTHSKYAQTEMQNDTLINQSTRNIVNFVDSRIANLSAFYTKKFKKQGRTFSWNVTESYNESQAHGNLYQDVTYHAYNPTTTHDSIVDQFKTNRLQSTVLNSNMTYTEPLSKTLTVIVNYGLAVANSTADRRSFDPSSPGVYTVFDTTYSNNFRLKQVSNQGGAVLNFKKDKVTFNFGTKVTDQQYDQTDLFHNYETTRNFVNWDPQAFFRYNIAKQSSFQLYYNGRTTQPTIDQLQPLRVNTDQLNIVVGNPKLTPSFSNSIRLNYNSYKVLTGVSVFAYGSFSFTTNPIVNDTKIDSVGAGVANPGKTTTQFINLNQKPYNFYGGFYYGRKIEGPDFQVGMDLNANGNKNYALANDLLNAISSDTYAVSLRVSKYVEKKYDFNLSFGPNYTFSNSSLQRNVNNNGHGYQGYGGAEVYLPGKFQIGTDANYQYNSPTQTFAQAYSKLLWNASITKSFTKDESFKVIVNCNDILNQNSGFDRTIGANLITQDHYTTLKRFFMLSLVWDFNHMGGGAPKAQ